MRLEAQKLHKIVAEVARTTMPPNSVQWVESRARITSDGGDGVHITIVISDSAADKVTGDHYLRTLSSVRDRLDVECEERLPTIGYATVSELASEDTEA